MLLYIIIAVILFIYFCKRSKRSNKAKFASIEEILEDHDINKNHCEYQNRQYPVGKIPGSNLILTPAELEELTLFKV